MSWNRRLLAALMAMVLFGLGLSAEEPSAGAKSVAEKKNDAAQPQTPAIPDGLHYLPDQVYCIPDEDTKLMADLLLPKSGKGPFPTVICLHGGGWVKGTRKTNLPIMIKLAEAGYVAVSVQYRLAKEAAFPSPIHDVKCAVRWLRASAEVFHVNTDRIAALGYSSGGNMACLLGLTTPLDGLEGEGGFPKYSSRVHVVISYAGISDLAAWHKDASLLTRFSLGKYMPDSPDKVPDLYKKGSPSSYARGDLAAVLLIHGTEDEWVPFKQSENMETSTKRRSPIDMCGLP